MASDEVPILNPTVDIGVILGEDIGAKDVLPPVLEPELPPFVDRPFEAATYQPRTHALTPGDSQEDWRLRIHFWSPTLVWEASCGGPHIGRCCWVRAFLLRTGTNEGRATTIWGPSGEMVGHHGLVPLFIDRGVDFDPLHLLGVIPNAADLRMVRYSWFLDHFTDLQPVTPKKVAQYACGFLMYHLGTTMFANTENTVGLYILGALVHLPQVVEYDWGGTGLATLYCYISSISRRKAYLLGGYWRVWELWVYTYFTSLAPVPVRPIELSVPRSRYYNSQFEQH
ncbi:hypothetical protein ACSBR1_027372 [Camellia fascicularis]